MTTASASPTRNARKTRYARCVSELPPRQGR
jgi:hypothetical protein